jgi:hypothetical protein
VCVCVCVSCRTGPQTVQRKEMREKPFSVVQNPPRQYHVLDQCSCTLTTCMTILSSLCVSSFRGMGPHQSTYLRRYCASTVPGLLTVAMGILASQYDLRINKPCLRHKCNTHDRPALATFIRTDHLPVCRVSFFIVLCSV